MMEELKTVSFKSYFIKDKRTWIVKITDGKYSGLLIEYVLPKVERTSDDRYRLHFDYIVDKDSEKHLAFEQSINLDKDNKELMSILGHILLFLMKERFDVKSVSGDETIRTGTV